MAKFTVTVEEEIRYTMEVEAENEDEAGAAAIEMVVQSSDPFKDFIASVEEREVFMVVKT
jgi:hypothetical protein